MLRAVLSRDALARTGGKAILFETWQTDSTAAGVSADTTLQQEAIEEAGPGSNNVPPKMMAWVRVSEDPGDLKCRVFGTEYENRCSSGLKTKRDNFTEYGPNDPFRLFSSALDHRASRQV